VQLEELDLVWRILLVGIDGCVSFPLDVISFPLFNYRTMNLSIVINNFLDSMLYEID
jgi:hypothetical protein